VVAFRLAVDRDHSLYDTLLVALTISREQKLLTYDRKLLGKFPEWTLTVTDFLGEMAHLSVPCDVKRLKVSVQGGQLEFMVHRHRSWNVSRGAVDS